MASQSNAGLKEHTEGARFRRPLENANAPDR